MEVAAAFDTHRFVKNLMANGFTEKQAEVLASRQAAMLNSNPATKADIWSVNERIEALRSDTEKLRLETVARIAELKADLQRWIIAVIATLAGILVALGGLVVALLRLL